MTIHANNGITTGGLNFWRTNPVGLVPWIARNPTGATITEGTRVVGAGKLSLHPGAAGQVAQIQFMVPVAGNYRVTGAFFGQDNGAGTSTDVHILRNSVAVFSGAVAGFGSGSNVPFGLTLTLAAGGNIDFAVGYGPGMSNANDSTGLNASVVAIPTINSSTITNYTGYIIPSDATDADPSTNRHRIRTEAGIYFPVAGDYRVDWALLDSNDAVVATDATTVPAGSTGVITLNGLVVPATATPLAPDSLYRIKTTVIDVPSGAALASTTEIGGRSYIHFTGTNSASDEINVVGEVTAVALGQTWLLDTDPGNRLMPVTVFYKLHRYDDWLGASVNKIVAGDTVPSIVRNSNGAVQPASGVDTGFLSPLIASHVAGSPKTPAVITGSATMLVDPTSVLAPDIYRFLATISHIENPQRLLETPPVLVTRTGSTGSSAATQLDHFSGKLIFRDIATHFSHIAGSPSVYVPPPSPFPQPPVLRTIAPDSNSGTIDGRTDYHYGNGTPLNVSLELNGDAIYLGNPAPTTVTLTPDNNPARSGSINGVDFSRGSDVILDTSGAHGDVTATLPTGVGWTSNRSSGLLTSQLDFAGLRLDQNLEPFGQDAVATFAANDFFLCEETKPVFIEASSLTWDFSSGRFSCGGESPHSIRKPLLDRLENFGPQYPDPAMGLKRSNDHLYNVVTTAADISVEKGTSGGGEMSGTLGSAPGEMVTHFPYNSTVKWNTASSIHLAGDLIDVAPSNLAGVDPLVSDYWQHCQESVEAGCGIPKTETITFTPTSSTLFFTADGGLQAAGTVALPGPLSWGWNSNAAQYAQQVATPFTAGNFLMAGTFLRGDQNSLSDEDGAALLLLSGFASANLTLAERPLTAAYKVGLADYAGMNFRCTAGGFSGQSTLQGTPYGNYPLTNRSKYYARRSGVTGIHEATASGFAGTATLAGYLFHITKYGFSFLSNDLEDSLTAGDIDLPDPVDFTLPFTNLRLSCTGALESVDVTGAGAVNSKLFEFWNAPFTPFTIDFAATDSCNPANGTTLVLGFSAHASHFDTAFAGSLGIQPDGHFATEDDIAAGSVAVEVPTRLTLPASLTVTGTTGETYTLFPGQGAYLNDAVSGAGFWSIFGTLDVPFFEDMEVHLHASAAVADTLSPLYFMGGWPAQGWTDAATLTPFEVSVFDTAHNGFPSTATLDAYRKIADDGNNLYLPRAQKLWLGVIDFDYPLKWSNTSFNFLSRGPLENDFLVVRTQHELKFLDANNAEITFGVRYDGLPEISLSNFVFNAVDDATGVSSALISAAGDEVFGALENGVDEFNNTLSDEADKLLGRAVEAATSVPVDGLIAVVKNELAGSVWTAAGLQTAIDNYTNVSANQLGTALNTLGTAKTNPKSLLADLDLRLAKIEQGIDSVINTVTLDPVTGVPLATPANGLLKQVGLRREVFDAVGAALVDTLSDVSSTSVAGELNALIAAQEPALASVTATLTEVKAVITSLRSELAGSTGFGDEIRDLIAAANAQINAVSNNVGLQSAALFDAVVAEDLAAAGALDALGDEWHMAITQMIKDELYATQLTADLQTATRARLYDLQGSFNGAVDSAFASLNQAIRDALSPVLADLDDSINGFTGELNDKLGAGSLTGAAHINGDSLDALRLDATLQLSVPDALTMGGFIEIRELDSDGPESCSSGAPGTTTVEVEVGALNIGLAWTGLSLGRDTRADLSLKTAFQLISGLPVPLGLGGSFEMTQGSIGFETFKITTLAASAMFSIPNGGNPENYFAAVVGLDFGSYDLAGGIFLGRSCDLEPLEMIDPLVASVLPGLTFTGIYAYGEATFPIFGTGTCFFNISAKAGAGVFYGQEGPTYGGRMSLGIYGDALCAVSVGGEIDLVGAKTGNTYAFAGHGRVFGEAGVCPFCVKANFQCDFQYTDASGWDVDF